ncbi:MAG: amidase family protein [Paracoccaceae bacterium]
MEQKALIRAGKLSVFELMQETFTRIETVNPHVNALVNLHSKEDCYKLASENTSLGEALGGMPMAIKDLANVKGFKTTEGSPLYAERVAQKDDQMVARLRAAGALFIGKTNTPEFGLGSNTFNPVYGKTKNPYDLSKTCGGSSGGAAVALATRMVSISDGSDMMGSLRNPAAWNNVYGLRPTWGLIPPEPSGESFYLNYRLWAQWLDHQKIWLCYWTFKPIVLKIDLSFHQLRLSLILLKSLL